MSIRSEVSCFFHSIGPTNRFRKRSEPYSIFRHVSSVSLRIGRRERFVVLTPAALVLGSGLYPQPGIPTRQQAAEYILEGNRSRARQEGGDTAEVRFGSRATEVKLRRAGCEGVSRPAICMAVLDCGW